MLGLGLKHAACKKLIKSLIVVSFLIMPFASLVCALELTKYTSVFVLVMVELSLSVNGKGISHIPLFVFLNPRKMILLCLVTKTRFL